MTKKAKSVAKASKEARQKISSNVRPVLYENDYSEKVEITAERAKELLGWEEEQPPHKKFGSDYLLKDRNDVKIRCINNPNNRPFYPSNCESLVQEILNKRWRFNGEPIIVGKTGLLLNGQHQLVGLVLAEQDRTGKQATHWATLWDGPVTMLKTIQYGVEEDDNTVNTLDTGKPRSLADALYRTEAFQKLKPKIRQKAARATDYAVRLLWQRTGLVKDPFTRIRTHSESLAFVERHPKLLKAVQHILKINQEGSLESLGLGLGYCAGLLYLMAASQDDGDTYFNATPPNESLLRLGRWEKACEFWEELAALDGKLRSVRYALAGLRDPDNGRGGSLAEQVGVVILAWNLYQDGDLPQEADLVLHYLYDEDGGKHLDGHPEMAGIDRGPGGKRTKVKVFSEESSEEAEEPQESSSEAPEEENSEEESQEFESTKKERLEMIKQRHKTGEYKRSAQ
jgi:hypothetical protein